MRDLYYEFKNRKEKHEKEKNCELVFIYLLGMQFFLEKNPPANIIYGFISSFDDEGIEKSSVYQKFADSKYINTDSMINYHKENNNYIRDKSTEEFHTGKMLSELDIFVSSYRKETPPVKVDISITIEFTYSGYFLIEVFAEHYDETKKNKITEYHNFCGISMYMSKLHSNMKNITLVIKKSKEFLCELYKRSKKKIKRSLY